eukprot:scaffold2857_cov344-Pavlova_lutheri.AAC.32
MDSATFFPTARLSTTATQVGPAPLMVHPYAPDSLAARLTDANPGMRGPLAGSTTASEPSASPKPLASPSRMDATSAPPADALCTMAEKGTCLGSAALIFLVGASNAGWFAAYASAHEHEVSQDGRCDVVGVVSAHHGFGGQSRGHELFLAQWTSEERVDGPHGCRCAGCAGSESASQRHPFLQEQGHAGFHRRHGFQGFHGGHSDAVVFRQQAQPSFVSMDAFDDHRAWPSHQRTRAHVIALSFHRHAEEVETRSEVGDGGGREHRHAFRLRRDGLQLQLCVAMAAKPRATYGWSGQSSKCGTWKLGSFHGCTKNPLLVPLPALRTPLPL